MPLITIAATTIPGWQGNSSGVSLRIYVNEDFTAQSGTLYPKSVTANPSSLGTFFQSYSCSVAAGQLGIPQVQLDSTEDSPDNPDATYSAVLWDSASGKPIQTFGTQSQFAVPAGPVNTTWAAIFAAEVNQ